ncbi:hypothetical protein [Undibacterium sp. Ji49W]|uniref:hypothetical protein n=1 Tax=Undibacterium sp. Ji49W TaxID=3413040 RepID=UPI003BF12510
MFNWTIIAIGLFAGGFVYGWRRQSLLAWEASYFTWAMAFVFGTPVVSLLLANLFGSTTLGWIFGLAAMLVWPLAFLLFLGKLTGGLFNVRSRQGNQRSMLQIRIDRDSVHAGDDTVSHAENIAVPANISLENLLEQIHQRNFLPSISGGKATWMIESSGAKMKTIGVLAQQWQEPCLMIDSSVEVASHFAGQQPNLFFRYLCQIDPDTARSQLHASYTSSIAETKMQPAFRTGGLARYATYLRTL